MLKLAALLSLFVIGSAEAGQLDASWMAPTTNADGSPLNDLSKFKLYFSTSPTPCPGTIWLDVKAPSTTPAPNTTVSVNLPTLVAGTRYTASVTAVDLAGNESDCSMTASAIARPDPPPISKPSPPIGVVFQ